MRLAALLMSVLIRPNVDEFDTAVPKPYTTLLKTFFASILSSKFILSVNLNFFESEVSNRKLGGAMK